ncbi:hypothetical protein AWB67_01680 [Caballeronia terrestris]|jgi:hypothetical protein|uniref:DUF2917 domain-containing protein n=1 Tax=Caballeronia terrestris TaxID=1226301 RepID=A0A158HE58_9BURK|nr:DUF2917 domain-containing protein [Caballeronia terrestris]SAL42628.1 hypothetical protein AWB67_01680 [Caballeronia terrestris]
MREISTSVTFEIKPGETVPMRIGRSTRLKVQGAAVWATRSNDIEDYWLVPGDTLKLRERERLWLSVEGDRAAQVVFTICPRPDQRAATWLAYSFDRLVVRFRSGWRTV